MNENKTFGKTNNIQRMKIPTETKKPT